MMGLRTGWARQTRQHGAAAVEPDTIRAALAQLSDPQRAMIYRSHYLGRSTAEIAVALDTDDEAVKDALHRALHTLLESLRPATPQSGSAARHRSPPRCVPSAQRENCRR